MPSEKSTAQTSLLHLSDFMCVCSDESRAEAHACHARAIKDLETTPEDLLTAVVYGLEWGLGPDHFGQIAGIHCDQWAGASAEVFEYVDGKAQQIASIWVQCDVVEHGIARIWELAKQAAEVDTDA